MSASIISLGIVGCGLVVERGHLPALAGIEGSRLVAVADPLADRRQIATGVQRYPELGEMLAAEQLDAVLICSPPALHLPHAEECARAGIQTLVEKPPGLTREETCRLAGLRPEPVIGFNRRFARGLPIGRRAVGNPSRITAIFDAPPGDWVRPGGPEDPLLDLGCHLVDLGCWITGTRPARGRAVALASDRIGFELEMADGLRMQAECGPASSYRELLEVRGDTGELRSWRWPVPAPAGVVDRLLRRPSPLLGSWRAQLEALADLVRSGSPSRLAFARQSIAVMAALEVLQASATGTGEWLTIAADA